MEGIYLLIGLVVALGFGFAGLVFAYIHVTDKEAGAGGRIIFGGFGLAMMIVSAGWISDNFGG